MKATEDMIEAACKARTRHWDAASGLIKDAIRANVEAELNAALAAAPPSPAVPVVWVRRGLSGILNFTMPSAKGAIPLYASPPSDEVEKLRWELNLMKTSGIIEVAVRNPSVSDYMNHWEGRATAAEVKVEKLVAALEPFAKFRTPAHLGAWTDQIGEHFRREQFEAARATLEEVKP